MKEPAAGIDSPAAPILASSDVWDMTLPWLPVYWDMDILRRYKRAGFTFVSLTLQDWPPTFDGMRQAIEHYQELSKSEASWLTFGSSLADIDRGRHDGKLVLGLNSQETRLIGEDLALLGSLHGLGVRHMLLAYNVRNLVADGCAEVADAGLSNFGRRVVREMNRVGIIVDCSHTGRRSSLEAIEYSEHPVIFSHSNTHALCPHIRNITDEQIKACAKRGGVIGVVGVGAFLGDAEARTASMFRHIDHIATLVGPEHVGLGTDYVRIMPVSDYLAEWQSIGASAQAWPDSIDGWPDPTGTQIPVEASHCFMPEQLGELVSTMLDGGYSIKSIKGILGGNFRRIYAAAEVPKTPAADQAA